MLMLAKQIKYTRLTSKGKGRGKSRKVITGTLIGMRGDKFLIKDNSGKVALHDHSVIVEYEL